MFINYNKMHLAVGINNSSPLYCILFYNTACTGAAIIPASLPIYIYIQNISVLLNKIAFANSTTILFAKAIQHYTYKNFSLLTAHKLPHRAGFPNQPH